MSNLDIDARYACAKSLALEAAQLGMDYYRQRETLDVEHKGSDQQDVVSIADKSIEDFIRARLAEQFPQDGFLGEESGSADLKARCVWVIDPIDGTACFVNGSAQLVRLHRPSDRRRAPYRRDCRSQP